MFDYTSIDSYTRNPLKKVQLDLVLPDYEDTNWFMRMYQSRTARPQPRAFKLDTLLQAIHNSESLVMQLDLDDKNISSLAQGIFVEDGWLHRDITLGMLNGVPHIVGGRHRVNAILNTLAQVIRSLDLSPEWKQHRFTQVLNFNIRCDEYMVKSTHDLIQMILSDNDSRRMRGAETASMDAQLEGIPAGNITAVGDTVVNGNYPPSQRAHLGANAFISQTKGSIPPQTKKEIGKAVAKFVLYGASRNKLQVQTGDEFNYWMQRAYDILVDLHNSDIQKHGKSTITPAKKAAYTAGVIEQLKREKYDTTPVYRAV